jgi:hypothetical protein
MGTTEVLYRRLPPPPPGDIPPPHILYVQYSILDSTYILYIYIQLHVRMNIVHKNPQRSFKSYIYWINFRNPQNPGFLLYQQSLETGRKPTAVNQILQTLVILIKY